MKPTQLSTTARSRNLGITHRIQARRRARTAVANGVLPGSTQASPYSRDDGSLPGVVLSGIQFALEGAMNVSPSSDVRNRCRWTIPESSAVAFACKNRKLDCVIVNCLTRPRIGFLVSIDPAIKLKRIVPTLFEVEVVLAKERRFNEPRVIFRNQDCGCEPCKDRPNPPTASLLGNILALCSFSPVERSR